MSNLKVINNKKLFLFGVGIVLMIALSIVVIAEAPPRDDPAGPQSDLSLELDGLIEELEGGNYSWLVDSSVEGDLDSADVEVYTENSNEVVTTFYNVSEEGWYKVYLTNLSGSFETFDLKVICNGRSSAYPELGCAGVEFDYIVDPSFNVTDNTGTNRWSNGTFVNTETSGGGENVSLRRDGSYTNQTDGFQTTSAGNNNPQGLTTNGSDFWVLDTNDGFVYHFVEGVNQSDGFSTVSAGAASIRGITTNGSDFWILDQADDFIYHFNMSGDNQTDGFAVGSTGSTSVVTNGSDFWTAETGGAGSYVMHFNSSGDNQTDSFIIGDVGNGDPWGIVINGSDFWVADSTDNFVYHYNASGNNTGNGFSTTSSGGVALRGLTSNCVFPRDAGTCGTPTDFWFSDYGNSPDFVFHFADAYQSSGSYTSEIFDAGSSVLWGNISWSNFNPEASYVNCIDSVTNHYIVTDNGDNTCTVSYQPNATYGKQSNYLDSIPDGNSGEAQLFWIGKREAVAQVYRAPIQFNFSDIPTNAIIVSANLTLTVDNVNYIGASGDVAMYRLKRDWIEGTGNGLQDCATVGNGVSWNAFNCTDNWQTAGGFGANDAEQTAVATTQILSSASINDTYAWNIDVNAIQEMINGTWTNNGFLMKGTNEAVENMVGYDSDDGEIASQKPILNITYQKIMPSSNIAFQVRSCDDAVCSGEEFNTSVSSTSPIILNESTTPNNQYFQYNVSFLTGDTTITPYLEEVNVSWSYVAPSFTTNPSINSTDLSNNSNVDLWCNFVPTEAYGNTITSDIRFYKNNVSQFNLSSQTTTKDISNAFNLSSGNLSDTERWKCEVRLYDTLGYSGWVNSSELLINDTAPTVTLNAPATSNYSVSFASSLFNCSGTSGTYDLDNVTLYHDVNGSWLDSGLQDVNGSSDDGTFTFGLNPANTFRTDGGFNWNCLFYDEGGSSQWASTNNTFGDWDLGSYVNTETSGGGENVSLKSGAWDVSTAVYSQVKAVAIQDTVPKGLFFKPDGTKMYIVGDTSNAVHEFNLSTAWDVSTATASQNFSVGDGDPGSVFFKPDGTKMYVIGGGALNVFEFNLSTAWNINTSVFSQVRYVGGENNNPSGVFFKPNGLKMYVTARAGKSIHEYNLSTAWNINTSVLSLNFSVESEETSPEETFFKPDGTKMYVVGSGGDAVHEYNLSTAWSINTSVFSQNYSIGSQETVSRALFFKPDGTKMYVVGQTGDDVNEYDLPFQSSGSYTSEIFDAGSSVVWGNVSWGNFYSGSSYVNASDGFSTVAAGSAAPRAMTTNGSDFWVYDSTNEWVHHFDAAGNNITDGFDARGGASDINSLGITTNGSDFWIADYTVGNRFIYHFNSSGDNQTDGFPTIMDGVTKPVGITTNGSDFWVVGYDNSFVHHYDADGTNMTDGFTATSAGVGDTREITTNGSDFWIVDVGDNFVYHFNSSGDNQTDGFIPVSGTYGMDNNCVFPRDVNGCTPTDFWFTNPADGFLHHFGPPIIIQVRSCDDVACSGESLGEIIGTSGFSSLSVDNNQYFQYNVSFLTGDTTITPYLEEVNVSYHIVKPSFTTNPSINSTDLSNNSNVDLWCNFVPTEAYGNTITSDIRFYKNNVSQFNLSSQTTTKDAMNAFNLSSGNLSDTERWKCEVRLYDTLGYSGWVNSSELLINDTAPTVTLNAPATSNYSVSFASSLFNCSGTSGTYDLDNVTLYHDVNGSWAERGLQDVNGSSDDGTFTFGLNPANTFRTDGGFNWNCLFYDEGGSSQWASTNNTFGDWDLGSYVNTETSGGGSNVSLKSGAWDVNKSVFLQNYSTTLDGTNLRAIFFKPDGTKMYLGGPKNSGEVGEYNLSTAWDVSTAIPSQVKSTTSEEGALEGMFFKPDGTKMYVTGDSDDVNEYNLSIAWDVSTATFSQLKSVTTEEKTPRSMFFKDDGTKMYVTGSINKNVSEYNLSIAWDVSTAILSQRKDVSDKLGPQGIFFKPDGTKMYLVAFGNVALMEYNLSIAWDVSTATYYQNFSASSEETNLMALFFKPDGTKMYLGGYEGDDVNEYDLPFQSSGSYTSEIFDAGSAFTAWGNISWGNFYSGSSYVNASDGFQTVSSGNADLYGITSNNSDYWVIDNADDFLYHYNSAGTNQTDGINLKAGSSTISSFGATTNGSDFWVTDNTAKFVNHFNSAGTNQTDGFLVSEIGASVLYGITTNGSDFWIIDNSADFILHYDANGNNVTDGFDITNSGSDSPIGITTNGSDFWIADVTDNWYYHFNSTGGNITDGFSLAGSTAGYGITSNCIFPRDVGVCGTPTDFRLVENTDDFVYHFKLPITTQVRTCDDVACSGETFTDALGIGFSSLSVDNNQYFQYNVSFVTGDTTITPYLEEVNVSYHSTNSAPSVPELNAPSNASIWTSIPALNWSNSTDAEGDTITYFLQVDNDYAFSSVVYENATAEIANTTGLTPVGLTDAKYYWRVLSSDGSSNSSYSTIREFTYDIVSPAISITTPTNGSYYPSTTEIYINYTFSDSAIGMDSCWYSNNSGTTNNTITCGTNLTTQTWESGLNTVWIYANDSLGNVNNSESVSFTVDTTSPAISIVTPSNGSSYPSTTGIYINYTFSDSGVGMDSCWYSNNSGTTNNTITCGTNLTTQTWESGLNTVWIYANDSLGNVNNSESVSFTVDTTRPLVTITSPTVTTYTSNPISFSSTLNEVGSCRYSLDVGATNTSMTSSDNLTFTASSTLADGTYNSYFYCNDSAGNTNYTENVTGFIVAIPAAVSPGGGGSSGSSAGATESSVNFRLGNGSYETTLPVSGVAYKTLEIISEESSKKTFAISTNLKDIIVLDQESMTLEGGETGKLVFKIVAPDETGLYAGKVIVKSGSTTRTLLFSINVKTEKSLYDLTILISDELKVMKFGETLGAQVGLLQAGIKESMDVTLNYLIKDFDGNVHFQESETIQVYDQKSFYREFYTGELITGDYVLGVELIYPDGVAVASSQFKIEEKFKFNNEQYILIGLIAIVMISLTIVIIKYKRTKFHHR